MGTKAERDDLWKKYRRAYKPKEYNPEDKNYEMIIKENGQHFVRMPWDQELAAGMDSVFFYERLRCLLDLLDDKAMVSYWEQHGGSYDQIESFGRWLEEESGKRARQLCQEEGDRIHDDV